MLCLQASIRNGIVKGRNGYGSIYVVASGNGGTFDDNCNFDGYANSIYFVTIGKLLWKSLVSEQKGLSVNTDNRFYNVGCILTIG